MKNVVLEDKVNRIINEELGIANEVSNLTNIIENRLMDLIKNNVYEGNFKVETELSSLSVEYVLKDFENEDEANGWIAYERGNDGYSYRNNTIYMSIVSINGNIDYNDLVDTLQHECTHYWEMKNMGRDLYDSNYQDVVNGIRDRNEYVSMTYSVIYYSHKNELDAFVSGSYASAMKKGKQYKNYKEFIIDNGVVEPYNELKDAIDKMSILDIEHDILFEFAANKIGCDKNYLAEFIKNTAELGMEYLLKRVGKAYTLYLKNKRD